MKGNWGGCVILTVFVSAFLCFFVACECLIYFAMKFWGAEYNYSLDFTLHTAAGRFMLVLRLAAVFLLILPEMYISRRMFIDIIDGKSFVTSRRYIQHNMRKIYPRALASVLVTLMLKFFGAVPIAVGVYEIYYWGWVCKLNELTSAGLFCFMLSLGFTFVWTGVFIHYCISLSLTNYIMSLNPRANVFDACDLSVRLMDGKHVRYLSFMFSFVKFIPLFLLVYPAFAIIPYFVSSYTVFVEDIMGSYWQDKLPAMIQRWKKHVR